MNQADLGADAQQYLQETLGYLNFSSGAPDPRFLASLNSLFGHVQEDRTAAEPAYRRLGELLKTGLEQLSQQNDAFRKADQARAVLRLVFDEGLPAYRRHHRDLLFHQTDEMLFQPFFLGRFCEAVLQQGGPWDETDRILGGALERLNDYLGHRPVAVLRTQQKIQPYAHEWVHPIPLYIRGAGVAVGPYRELIEGALKILQATDPSLLFQAWFQPEMLDELAVDPRAYDFEHPANKRPNYLFGQWDMQRLDNSGRCRRFVLQQVALDAMLQRLEDCGKLPREEMMFEASAVLAGTMLMGAGVSGNRPDAHDSSATLATLVQHIAAYRDAFYEQLLGRMTGPHAERLRIEALKLHQPFAGPRQDFNLRLARRRARQLQHVQLAVLFSRMGYLDAAREHVGVVPVVSARMQCDIHCLLYSAVTEIEQGRLQRAASLLPEIEDLLHRGIECGALVDPWNILGFGAQYSLFPAVENSVHDHRVDELVDVMAEIFDLYVQLEREAAAAGSDRLQDDMSEGLDRIAQWWDKYASTEVLSIEGISGQETSESARHVAAALREWHKAGTAAGDIAFWRVHGEQFRSTKTYALVVETLLDQGDPVAAMALLVQWINQSDEIPLIDESYAFDDLALRWMEGLWAPGAPEDDATVEDVSKDDAPRDDAPVEESSASRIAPHDRWPMARKFLDYLEANAGEHWEVPEFKLGDDSHAGDQPGPDDDSDNLFGAAYEGVTYRDSTDDGFEGEMIEGGQDVTDFELVEEADRIIVRLSFLTMLARLWKLTAVASMPSGGERSGRDDVLAQWLHRATINRRRLSALLAAVHHYRIPAPRGTFESLVEYDRRRGVKETLLEQIIAACLETADAARMIRAAMDRDEPFGQAAGDSVEGNLDDWEEAAGQVLRAALRSDVPAVRKRLPDLFEALTDQPLLYVALARGGNPQRIVASRNIQRVLRLLLGLLPRLGLLGETVRLIEAIQDMELDHPVGHGAITEFDRMFRIGCKAVVRCLVISAEDWPAKGHVAATAGADPNLIGCLEEATEALLRSWLVHSRGVRLSVLESVKDNRRWRELKDFIERYGADLFTQRFMNLGNLRGILHQGVEAYLESLKEDPEAEEELRLVAELDGPIPSEDAARWLGLVLEAVVENYSEYIDYNTTTTQSDRGEMLYTLLDFLRLQTSYDRVAWNLLPVMLAHEVLVRCGREDAADIWRDAIAARSRNIAADHQRRLTRLVRKYGMRLQTVADRLGERFVRPLAIDRLRALVGPAIDELRGGRDPASFRRLEAEIVRFTDEPSGSGFELPPWLDALGKEVDQIESDTLDEEDGIEPYFDIPQVRLTPKEARRQVRAMLDE